MAKRKRETRTEGFLRKLGEITNHATLPISSTILFEECVLRILSSAPLRFKCQNDPPEWEVWEFRVKDRPKVEELLADYNICHAEILGPSTYKHGELQA
ncbi:hypothetical protein E3J85_02385 [Patescibacteria group bacterium]|nr:MAG: hypothetical protein E3J85_02385 [Patescibacteria group bacterium]